MKLTSTNSTPPIFSGLAEIRIAAGDTPGAVELLRRLVVVVGNPFENLDPAAALLEKTGHNAEAIEFLEQLVKSAPWEAAYRCGWRKQRSPRARMSIQRRKSLWPLRRARMSPTACERKPRWLWPALHRPVELGSAELNLLASGTGAIAASAADQPFFYEARLRAAQAAGRRPSESPTAGERAGRYSRP